MHYSLRRKKKRDARTFGACGESGEKWGRCGERSGLAGERHGSSMEAVWKQYGSGMEAGVPPRGDQMEDNGSPSVGNAR